MRSVGAGELSAPLHRIVYRVQEEQVHVLTVFEGHRLLPTDAVTESDDD